MSSKPPNWISYTQWRHTILRHKSPQHHKLKQSRNIRNSTPPSKKQTLMQPQKLEQQECEEPFLKVFFGPFCFYQFKLYNLSSLYSRGNNVFS